MSNHPFGTPPNGPMPNRLVIEMTSDGEFRAPPSVAPGMLKLGAVAILVAVVSGALVLAAVALWLAFLLIPIAIGAAAIGYVALRLQSWQARRQSPLARRP